MNNIIVMIIVAIIIMIMISIYYTMLCAQETMTPSRTMEQPKGPCDIISCMLLCLSVSLLS